MAVAKLRVFLGRVEDSMSYLMAFQGDHLIDAACKACPDLANEIHEGSERGDSPLRLASELLRIMFVAEIEKLPADQRELLATYLASPREAPPSTFAKFCRIYCGQIYTAKYAKQLDEQWCLDCAHEVFFAAQGLSAEERSNDRMRRALALASAALVNKVVFKRFMRRSRNEIGTWHRVEGVQRIGIDQGIANDFPREKR